MADNIVVSIVDDEVSCVLAQDAKECAQSCANSATIKLEYTEQSVTQDFSIADYGMCVQNVNISLQGIPLPWKVPLITGEACISLICDEIGLLSSIYDGSIPASGPQRFVSIINKHIRVFGNTPQIAGGTSCNEYESVEEVDDLTHNNSEYTWSTLTTFAPKCGTAVKLLLPVDVPGSDVTVLLHDGEYDNGYTPPVRALNELTRPSASGGWGGTQTQYIDFAGMGVCSVTSFAAQSDSTGNIHAVVCALPVGAADYRDMRYFSWHIHNDFVYLSPLTLPELYADEVWDLPAQATLVITSDDTRYCLFYTPMGRYKLYTWNSDDSWTYLGTVHQGKLCVDPIDPTHIYIFTPSYPWYTDVKNGSITEVELDSYLEVYSETHYNASFQYFEWSVDQLGRVYGFCFTYQFADEDLYDLICLYKDTDNVWRTEILLTLNKSHRFRPDVMGNSYKIDYTSPRSYWPRRNMPYSGFCVMRSPQTGKGLDAVGTWLIYGAPTGIEFIWSNPDDSSGNL